MGACRDQMTDSSNCGACDNACTSAQRCTAGRCVTLTLSCPAGMLPIPAGMFLMGDANFAETMPVHGVRLSAFCIDETEVTVASYRSCVMMGICSAPETRATCNWGKEGRDQHPVNCVGWEQAVAYCRSKGAALPTEAQWEYSARGTDGRIYPWGSEVPGSQLCWNRLTVPGSTCPVRSYPSGNSPFGIYDLSGNLWEWTADWYGGYTGDSTSYVVNPTGPTNGTTRVIHGGSWVDLGESPFRAAYRFHGDLARGYNSVGFRCAASFPGS